MFTQRIFIKQPFNLITLLNVRSISRNFRSGADATTLGGKSGFPKHKELFTDMYYEEEGAPSAFE